MSCQRVGWEALLRGLTQCLCLKVRKSCQQRPRAAEGGLSVHVHGSVGLDVPAPVLSLRAWRGAARTMSGWPAVRTSRRCCRRPAARVRRLARRRTCSLARRMAHAPGATRAGLKCMTERMQGRPASLSAYGFWRGVRREAVSASCACAVSASSFCPILSVPAQQLALALSATPTSSYAALPILLLTKPIACALLLC